MIDIRKSSNKYLYIFFVIFLVSILLCACQRNHEKQGQTSSKKTNQNMTEESRSKSEDEAVKQIEKGYDLPVDDKEKEEAETDSKRVMELLSDIYINADKGDTLNAILLDETIFAMQDKVKQTKYPVTTMVMYSNMENYKEVDRFLKECMKGKSGSTVIYEICNDGSIGRMKYIFNGTDMYVLSTSAVWNEENKPEIAYISYTRIKTWKYSDKGWFGYELCVPEPPEVSELIDGSCLYRVKPLTKKQRKMSQKCVKGLGYQGNNLLCSNWDIDHMGKLDYNGLYEYLYEMKYHKKFNSEDTPKGIPRDQFEKLIMEYLPVTAQQIRKYAVFSKKKQTYEWQRLGCFNYELTYFGTSIPEVTDIRKNKDGTITLTVDAVRDMVVFDDAVITHELTVRFAKDGSFQYLGNKILDNGIKNIPDHQYRIQTE